MTLIILGLAFILLTAVGLPISFAVGVACVIATFLLPGVDNATIAQRMLTAINTFPLLAVIFFVFAGVLMARGGIARRLVYMAEVLVGWMPGALRRSSASPRCSSAASPALLLRKSRPSAA
jgi:TRAP-type mannitol/chloroaromatic compound transport system permease large subunit